MIQAAAPRTALAVLLGLLLVPITSMLGFESGARASTERHALIIGNNRGLVDDLQLRYAVTDARRLADVLTRLGGFAEGNTTVLEDQPAVAVRRALLSINERIRQNIRPEQKAVLFVFYSGHADAEALHLSGTTLSIEELRKLVVSSAAAVRTLILDACRSGGATRVKGGRPGKGFSIALVDRVTTEGYAIVTSSSQTEDSQESDRLQASFFTHFLISALRGAADRNGDGRVTLGEAYAYTYESTLRATSRTFVGPQHPTYEYGIRGKGDFVVTQLDRGSGHGTLRFPSAGHFLVMQGSDTGPVVAEVLSERPGVRVVLPAGRYFVRRRTPNVLFEGPVAIDREKVRDLDPSQMRRVAYAQLVRKGQAKRLLSHGPQVGWTMRGPIAGGVGPLSQIEAAYPIALEHIRLTPRFAYGLYETTSTANVALTPPRTLLGRRISLRHRRRACFVLRGAGRRMVARASTIRYAAYRAEPHEPSLFLQRRRRHRSASRPGLLCASQGRRHDVHRLEWSFSRAIDERATHLSARSGGRMASLLMRRGWSCALIAMMATSCGDPLAGTRYAGENPIVAGRVRISKNVEDDIKCGTALEDDCLGLLFVAVIDRAAPLGESQILGSVTVPEADLTGVRAVPYAISGLPTDQALFVAGYLSERGRIAIDPPHPEDGDLYIAPIEVNGVLGGVTQQDLELKGRWPPP